MRVSRTDVNTINALAVRISKALTSPQDDVQRVVLDALKGASLIEVVAGIEAGLVDFFEIDPSHVDVGFALSERILHSNDVRLQTEAMQLRRFSDALIHVNDVAQVSAQVIGEKQAEHLGFLIEKLGSGAEGDVYLAVIPDQGVVAVKVPNLSQRDAGLSGQEREEALERQVLREAAKMGSHKGTGLFRASVITAVDHTGTALPAVHMPLMEPLHEFLQTATLAEVFAVMGHVGRGLENMHNPPPDEGGNTPSARVHRDVKPANFLVQRHAYGVAGYLSDFGMAENLGPDGTVHGISGTVRYMDGRILTGSGAHPGTDVHSFALAFAEVLTGKPPFASIPDNDPNGLVMAKFRGLPADAYAPEDYQTGLQRFGVELGSGGAESLFYEILSFLDESPDARAPTRLVDGVAELIAAYRQ